MKMTGSNYFDTLIGSNSRDSIYGNDGNDLISAWNVVGLGAREFVDAGAGDDLISGFSVVMDNPVRSKSRGSEVQGGGGNDTLIIDASGSARKIALTNMSTVFQVSGVEEIIYNFSGATTKQTITGTRAGETIYIGEGGSKADGGKGNDYLFSGLGDDVLNGGDGNDFLSGGDGRNELTGGSGNDYFVFRLTEDYTYSNITDFKRGEDKIALILDIGGALDTPIYGDGLRFIERPMDNAGYITYDNGRLIARSDFEANTDAYNGHVIYEQETGSFLYNVLLDDGHGGELTFKVLLAHLDNKPNLDASDFVFMVL